MSLFSPMKKKLIQRISVIAFEFTKDCKYLKIKLKIYAIDMICFQYMFKNY